MALCQADGNNIGMLVGVHESNTILARKLRRDIKRTLQDKCRKYKTVLAKICATIYVNARGVECIEHTHRLSWAEYKMAQGNYIEAYMSSAYIGWERAQKRPRQRVNAQHTIHRYIHKNQTI